MVVLVGGGGGWLMGGQVGEWVALGRLALGEEKNGWEKTRTWMDEAETCSLSS